MASLEKKYLRTVSVNNNSKTVQMTDGKGFNIYPKTTADNIIEGNKEGNNIVDFTQEAWDQNTSMDGEYSPVKKRVGRISFIPELVLSRYSYPALCIEDTGVYDNSGWYPLANAYELSKLQSNFTEFNSTVDTRLNNLDTKIKRVNEAIPVIRDGFDCFVAFNSELAGTCHTTFCWGYDNSFGKEGSGYGVDNSTIFGWRNNAGGDYEFIAGERLYSSNDYEIALGRSNCAISKEGSPEKYTIFTIGNGEYGGGSSAYYDSPKYPHNAFAVLNDGTILIPDVSKIGTKDSNNTVLSYYNIPMINLQDELQACKKGNSQITNSSTTVTSANLDSSYYQIIIISSNSFTLNIDSNNTNVFEGILKVIKDNTVIHWPSNCVFFVDTASNYTITNNDTTIKAGTYKYLFRATGTGEVGNIVEIKKAVE